MRSGAPAGHTGFFHEVGFYRSDAELLALAMPFIEDGVAAGEPVVVTLDERNASLVQRHLGRAGEVSCIPSARHYVRPAAAVSSFFDLVTAHVRAGAGQVRVIGEVPHPGFGSEWAPWLRYEGAVTVALDALPLWAICAYDERSAPAEVLADAARVHPYVATAAGHECNGEFTLPSPYVRSRLPLAPHPLERRPPALSLDPVTSPAVVRRALEQLARRQPADSSRVADLVLAASEVTTNALRHGRGPVAVHAWAGSGVVVCTVRNAGPGPADPFVGLVPPVLESDGGYGLWIAHQVCDRVDLDEHEDGFVVRLVVAVAAG